MKLKLKSLLEGYAWERNSGKTLATLADVQKEYQENQNKQKSLTEGLYVGQTVKVKTPGMTHYNKVGEVVEQDAGGKFFTVEFPLTGQETELAYYHASDLKPVQPR